ncbi:hypothetical protein [Metapseudomonas otitidis]|uniref:hypothetical protein n=1 Tax=Metapseudomonas otitidis TaxID=319939 RepID=UPI0026370CF7|nr:hypothetical protein [Pseudomonas otitidis]
MRAIYVALIAVPLLGGCSTPPVKQPSISRFYDFKEAEFKGESLSGDIQKQLLSLAKQHAEDAKLFADNVDDSNNFRFWNDMVSIGTLGFAGVGALTNAHSDLYKASGALLGTSLGVDKYFNAEGQQAVYMRSADASYCSKKNLIDLSKLVESVTPQDIKDYKSAITKQAQQLNTVFANPTVGASLTALGDFKLGSTLAQAALNSDDYKRSQTEALDYLSDVQDKQHTKRLEIARYQYNEIKKIAYQKEAAFKEIKRLAVKPTDIMNAFKDTDPNRLKSSSVSSEFSEFKVAGTPPSPGFTNLRDNIDDIIKEINEYEGCRSFLTVQ